VNILGKIGSYIGAVALLFGLGFGVGWWSCSNANKASQAHQANAAVQTIAKTAQADLDHQAAVQKAQADATATFNASQLLLHDNASDIRQEIAHANLLPAAASTAVLPAVTVASNESGSAPRAKQLPQAAVDCDDPFGSPEFVQLYQRAINPAAAGTTARGAGGMP
jgi:hypothetical protein